MEKKLQRVKINKIIPISTVDGPGARTSIFVQGCNLKCGYCHNPETINLCVHCGKCVPGCPTEALVVEDSKVKWIKEKCIDCDNCIKVCPYLASPKVIEYDANELMVEIEKNIPFIRGITVSGGECTMYPQFLVELFTRAKKKNLYTLIDANGKIDFSKYPELVDTVDGIMLDIKAFDDEVFYKLTKGKRDTSLCNNIKYLLKKGKLFELRLVCHYKWVDVENALKGIKECIPDDYHKIPLKLIAFRNHSVVLSMKDEITTSKEEMEKYKLIALDLGYENIIMK